MKVAKLTMKEVFPSQTNARVDYNGTDMAELVKSIESVGLLSPIIVRQAGDIGYEIVAGHRRYHAMKKLGKEEIDVQVVEATDEDAALIQLTENLHRKDLNAIEEARSFAYMRDAFSLDVEAIARRADKSVPYVTRALALLTLPKVAVQAIESGKMPAEHGHQIARAPEKEREKLAKWAADDSGWSKQIPTLADLKREIEKKLERDLKTAVFPKEVEYASAMACTVCPHNTGNQSVLFDGAKAGKCTGPACFGKKTAAFYREMQAAGEKQFPGLKFVGLGTRNWSEEKEFKGYRILSLGGAKKDVLAKPDDHGFGIYKPTQYGSLKKPTFVIVSLKKSAAPAREAQPDYEKQRFVEERVRVALTRHAYDSIKKVTRDHVIGMIQGGGSLWVALGCKTDKDVKALVKKASFDDLLRMLWVSRLGWNITSAMEEAGIKYADVQKDAIKKAEAEYAAIAKKEKSK